MRSRREKTLLLNVLMGAGLYLLDSVRERLTGSIDLEDWSERARDRYGDMRDRVKDVYASASRRFDRVSDAIYKDDHPYLRATGAALLGAGVGVCIGVLLAPASGEETRNNLVESFKNQATGTFGS